MVQIITHVDNLHYAEDGSEVRADHTIRISYQVDDGEPVRGTLDLTGQHLAEYEESLQLLLEHADADRPDPGNKRVYPKKPSKASPVRSQGLSASRQFRKKQRKLADEYHIRAVEGPDRAAYLTPGGAAYWPNWFDRTYEWYLKTGRIVLPRRADSFPGAYAWRSYIKNWEAEEEEAWRARQGQDQDARIRNRLASEDPGDREYGFPAKTDG